MRYIDETVEVFATNTFLTLLWVVFLFPLYLAFNNAFAGEISEETYQEVPVIELPMMEEPVIKELEVIPEEIEEKTIELTDITVVNNSGFVWEEENSFERAFSMARSLLGPDKTFRWNNKLYHTNFVEEISLLTTKEQEFLQVPEGERE